MVQKSSFSMRIDDVFYRNWQNSKRMHKNF